MSELGSGSGSGYPSVLDVDNDAEVDDPSASRTLARSNVPNDLAAAIIAIQTELGTNPSGSLTDVKTFLQVEHIAADGTHGDVTADSLTMEGIFFCEDQIADQIYERDTAAVVNAIGSITTNQNLDHELGPVHTVTITANTITLSFTNPPISGRMGSWIVFMTNGGLGTLTFANVDWANGAEPVLTNSGVDILSFQTINGSSIVHGQAISIDSK
jgi:hypothetical protein